MNKIDKNKLIIVVYGVSGSGKSYLFNKFKEYVTSASFLSIDEINDRYLQNPHDSIKNPAELISYYTKKEKINRELSKEELDQVSNSILDWKTKTIRGYMHLKTLIQEHLRYTNILFVEGAFGGFIFKDFFSNLGQSIQFQFILIDKKKKEVTANFEKRKEIIETENKRRLGLTNSDVFLKVLKNYKIPNTRDLNQIGEIIKMKDNNQIDNIIRETLSRIENWRKNK